MKGSVNGNPGLIGSGIIAKIIQNLVKKKPFNQEMLALALRLTRWLVLIIGTILALDQVNFDVIGFIAGLGLAGFTIGFALQDITKNFVSGIMFPEFCCSIENYSL